MSRLRRLLQLHQPMEVVFFLFLGAFGVVITLVYWFGTYEPAGSALLAGYSLATGAVGLVLARDPRAAHVRRRAVERRAEGSDGIRTDDLAAAHDPAGEGEGAAGTGGIDRPFLDEGGRIPGETLAPFAVGLGAAFASTGLIFGLAPVLVGLLPFAWGAWVWLSGAGAELEATEAESDAVEAAAAAVVAEEDGRPVGATPGRSSDR